MKYATWTRMHIYVSNLFKIGHKEDKGQKWNDQNLRKIYGKCEQYVERK
jgi:hypothetical protein